MRHPRRLTATPHPQSGTTWGWNSASLWTQGDGVGMGEGPRRWGGGLGAFPLVLCLLPRQVLAWGLPLPRTQRPGSQARTQRPMSQGRGWVKGRSKTRVFSCYRVPQTIDALSD